MDTLKNITFMLSNLILLKFLSLRLFTMLLFNCLCTSMQCVFLLSSSARCPSLCIVSLYCHPFFKELFLQPHNILLIKSLLHVFKLFYNELARVWIDLEFGGKYRRKARVEVFHRIIVTTLFRSFTRFFSNDLLVSKLFESHSINHHERRVESYGFRKTKIQTGS